MLFLFAVKVGAGASHIQNNLVNKYLRNNFKEANNVVVYKAVDKTVMICLNLLKFSLYKLKCFKIYPYNSKRSRLSGRYRKVAISSTVWW